MQVDSIKPTLEAHATKRLNLTYINLLSSHAFKFNSRRTTRTTRTMRTQRSRRRCIMAMRRVDTTAMVSGDGEGGAGADGCGP